MNLSEQKELEKGMPQLQPIPGKHRPFTRMLPWIILWVFIVGGGLSVFAANRPLAGTAAENSVMALFEKAAPTPTLVATALPTSRLAPVFAPEVYFWEPQIIQWARWYDLDPDMVATVMQIESCGDPNALSGAGATGLFQVMPFHFIDSEDMFDPDTNARRGMAYLYARLEQANGDYGLAFAGYNGGHGATGSSWDHWAHETQRYYVWSTGIYGDAQAGLSSSPTLAQWLDAGGRSLCQQAARSQALLDAERLGD